VSGPATVAQALDERQVDLLRSGLGPEAVIRADYDTPAIVALVELRRLELVRYIRPRVGWPRGALYARIMPLGESVLDALDAQGVAP
jgi:hypothetical protein